MKMASSPSGEQINFFRHGRGRARGNWKNNNWQYRGNRNGNWNNQGGHWNQRGRGGQNGYQNRGRGRGNRVNFIDGQYQDQGNDQRVLEAPLNN